MTKKVLVTGGSGFLGAAVCKRMLASSYEVRVFDDTLAATRVDWKA